MAGVAVLPDVCCLPWDPGPCLLPCLERRADADGTGDVQVLCRPSPHGGTDSPMAVTAVLLRTNPVPCRPALPHSRLCRDHRGPVPGDAPGQRRSPPRANAGGCPRDRFLLGWSGEDLKFPQPMLLGNGVPGESMGSSVCPGTSGQEAPGCSRG